MSGELRFYLDENVSPEITPLARDLGIDVTDWRECSMGGRSDDEQLRFAAAQDRCLVTSDTDFLGWSSVFAERGESHAGVLMLSRQVRKRDIGAFAAALAHLVNDRPEKFAAYEVRWLPEAAWRVR